MLAATLTLQAILTPLTPVLLTASDMAEDLTIPDDIRDQVRMISRNVALEARLIGDLLDLTRIARGKLRLTLESVDAHELVRHAEEIVRSDMADRTLDLSLHLEASRYLPRADSTRLHQVFWNLLKNAVKFTPDGGKVTVRSWNPANDLLCVSVHDSGRGIGPGMLGRIFSTLRSGRPKRQTLFRRAGPWLAISKAIVELHGGHLTAGSQGEDKGSLFKVELPISGHLKG
jgi:two-component system CheB/CheR fusion protein